VRYAPLPCHVITLSVVDARRRVFHAAQLRRVAAAAASLPRPEPLARDGAPDKHEAPGPASPWGLDHAHQ
jgi:hypothetical protein